MKNSGSVRDFWEVRRGGEVICAGTAPFLGYPTRVLLDMYGAGLSLYKNGKRVKKCDIPLV